MITQLQQPPFKSPLTVPSSWTVTAEWSRWLLDGVLNLLQKCSQVYVTVPATTTRAASVATTTLWTVTQTGIYRVSWYEQITQAATVSSSLQMTLGWTTGGVAQASSDASALVSNTTASHQSGSIVIYADSGHPITYATTYASSGATPMNYKVALVVELVN